METSQSVIETSIGVNKPSITAGSSDGNIRLYFNRSGAKKRAEDICVRFVVTVQNYAGLLPKPAGARFALSYPFGVASSVSLEGRELHVTLEVRYKNLARLDMEFGYAIICCRDESNQDGDGWKRLPTYQFSSLGLPAAATSLDKQDVFYTQGKLFEQYQLWWYPCEILSPKQEDAPNTYLP